MGEYQRVLNIQSEEMVLLKSPLNLLENPEEYWKSTRKCQRCKKLYTEEENQSENSRCYYHSGTYTDPDNIMNGTLVGWSCCNQILEKDCFFNSLNPSALEYDGKGCKEKRYHEEDIAYTVSLKNFPYQTSDKTKKEEFVIPTEPVDFKKLESVSFSELEGNPNFFAHPVSITDTLVGISMKYDIPAGIIQRVNRLPTQQIFERKVLFVPKTKDNYHVFDYPTDNFKLDRDRIKGKFIITTKCSKEEANYYLDEAEYNYDEAIALFNEDTEWNKGQALMKGPTLKFQSPQPSKNRLC